MKENDSAACSLFYHLFYSAHHLFPATFRFSAFGKIEAEDSDVRRLKYIGQMGDFVEGFHMGDEVLIDADFSQGGTDGGYPDTCLVQLFFYLAGVFRSKIRYTDSVAAAQFDPTDVKIL